VVQLDRNAYDNITWHTHTHTHTHTIYHVTAFPRQHRLSEQVSVLHYTYIAFTVVINVGNLFRLVSNNPKINIHKTIIIAAVL
jgi:hypothetical protein